MIMILRIRTYIWPGGDGGDDDADKDDHGGDDDAHDDDEDDEDDDDDMTLTLMRTTRMPTTMRTRTTMMTTMIFFTRLHLLANMYKASDSQTLIDGVPHSLHFQFTTRCNRRCLLNAIVTPV